MDKEDLARLCGPGFSLPRFADTVPFMGATVEKEEKDEIAVEFFANRPDLFSVEGVSRAFRVFSPDLTPGDYGPDKYSVKGSSGIALSVGKRIAPIRPIIGGAYLEGVSIDEPTLVSIMNLQEKLHLTLGRKRRKVAIGIHDAAPLKPPFTYDAYLPDEIKFVPLGKETEWDLARILSEHEKGMDYAWTLEGFQRYPVITDSKGQVLSFPPIINGELTRVTTDTTKIFVDCTGTDLKAVSLAVNIVCAQLIDRGGMLKSVDISYPSMEPYSSLKLKRTTWPEFGWKEYTLGLSEATRLLGKKPDDAEVSRAMERMGYCGISANGGTLRCLAPPWRGDILHPWDLAEDLAIGMDYNSFKGTIPRMYTNGSERSVKVMARDLSGTLVGMGFLESRGITLSNENDQFAMMSREEHSRITIQNPITVDHTMIRVSALPSLLRLLSANKHRDLPQRLFEVADVMVGNRNRILLTGVSASSKSSFTEIKGVVQRILSDLSISPPIDNAPLGCYIKGRGACYHVQAGDGEYDGPFPELIGKGVWPLLHFGEINPGILSKLELAIPVSAFEIDLTLLDTIRSQR
jgi:phenylalanyl-tRNA synthetase beta chain